MNRSERGSATLHVLFAAVLLFTALAVAILWSAISTARHKLTAAADLTALSAAQSLTTTEPGSAEPGSTGPGSTGPGSTEPVAAEPIAPDLASARPTLARPTLALPNQTARASPPAGACVVAARAAALNRVQLRACEVTSTAVTVEVSLEIDLRLAHPTLTAIARAGPV